MLKANAHSSTFGFCRLAKPKQKTKKSLNFANARQKYIETENEK
jgi:hypothetical protein